MEKQWQWQYIMTRTKAYVSCKLVNCKLGPVCVCFYWLMTAGPLHVSSLGIGPARYGAKATNPQHGSDPTLYPACYPWVVLALGSRGLGVRRTLAVAGLCSHMCSVVLGA
jgi:hypothetical protein